jgi:hypothetical protein
MRSVSICAQHRDQVKDKRVGWSLQAWTNSRRSLISPCSRQLKLANAEHRRQNCTPRITSHGTCQCLILVRYQQLSQSNFNPPWTVRAGREADLIPAKQQSQPSISFA